MRSRNAFLNAISAMLLQILILGLNFVGRKVFLIVLDAEYLGVAGLFSNVVTMLSLAELGVGTAITYSLYKPLAENDVVLIQCLMSFFKKIYISVGFFIGIVGSLLAPVAITLLDETVQISNIYIIYLLFVLNTAVSYFFSYSRILVVASQHEYQLLKIDFFSKAGLTVTQIIVLLATHNYILYLCLQVLFTLLQNLLIYHKVQKEFPYLKGAQGTNLPSEVKATIKKNTAALLIYKSAVVLVSGTDNIIISKFLGTILVGLYSNYSMIVGSVQTIIQKIVSSVTSIIGNVIATETKEKSYEYYLVMQYICFLLYGICSVILIVLINPFITLFFGREYVLDMHTVFVVILNFFLLGMQGSSSIFRDAQGIFWQGKIRPIIQGGLNIVISIFLVMQTHTLAAVFWGTVLSRVFTVTFYDPYAVHKYGFGSLQNFKKFIALYIRYTLFALVCGIIIYSCISEIPLFGITGFFIQALLVTISAVCAFTIPFCKTKEFIFLLNLLKRIMSKKML